MKILREGLNSGDKEQREISQQIFNTKPMSFEIKDRDILGRIGKLKTRSGTVETPSLLPVVNPLEQPIPPREMLSRFKCKILMTNSYIIKKHFPEEAIKQGVHGLLNYEGVIATDSGGYQVLIYGDVDVSQEEIIDFQEAIRPDIAVILDHPTGWGASHEKAAWTVDITNRRAEEAINKIQNSPILWVGPVQGGEHLDLIEHSAQKLGNMPFQIYALGSPTQVMERYLFKLLVDMIMTAKRNLPLNRAFHLFGAGHPFMFALAVSLGCDLFDSAAYALYARDGRYMLPYGTKKLEELSCLPCSCPVCRSHDAEDLKDMYSQDRLRLLAEHNLYVSMAEIDRVKQAIKEGMLWELLEVRCRSHPALSSALRALIQYKNDLEKGNPSFKGRGVFYYDSASLTRPEITRHEKRILQNYRPQLGVDTLLLLPAPKTKPFSSSPEAEEVITALKNVLGSDYSRLAICFYCPPFSIVPLELSETYPLSQYEAALPWDNETLDYTATQIEAFASKEWFSKVVLCDDPTVLGNRLQILHERLHQKPSARLITTSIGELSDSKAINKLAHILEELMHASSNRP